MGGIKKFVKIFSSLLHTCICAWCTCTICTCTHVIYLSAVCQLNRMRRTPCGAAAASSRVSPWATPMSPGVTVATDSSGYRILSLDGGGIRGLIQIEVLSQLERLTGRRIRELFDCIIGTSTGGVIALTTVYCEYIHATWHVCVAGTCTCRCGLVCGHYNIKVWQMFV